MSDGMETYRAYLSAQKLAEALLAAHHDKDGRGYFLRAATAEITEASERISLAIRSTTQASSGHDAPAS